MLIMRPSNGSPEKLNAELVQLEIETGNLVRNYPLDEAFAMQSGVPRKGASPVECMARKKFARINDIKLILKTLEWLEPR